MPASLFAYWLVSLLAFGLATAWLAHHWLPERALWLAPLVGPILVLAPHSILGSTSPLLGWALPHMLGGCLASLALAALITRRYDIACVVTLLTAVAHVQHGANLAVVLLVSAVVLRDVGRRQRVALGGSAAFVVVMSVVVTRVRGLTGNGDDFLQICNEVVPLHCQANSWPDRWLIDGWALVGLVAMLVAARWRDEARHLVAPVVLPAVGLFVGVHADLADVAVLGELAQQTNVYRLVTLVDPFAAWALIGVVVTSVSASRRALAAVAVGLMATVWLSGASAALEGEVAASALVVVSVIGLSLVSASGRPSEVPWPLIGAPAAVLILVIALAGPALNWHPVGLGLDADDPRVVMGRAIEDATPPGSVIAAAPSLDWVRFMSRRAVVADCKAVPYGGAAWSQYQERMAALGGRACHDTDAFDELSLETVAALGERYGATHLLTTRDDPKWAAARDAGWEVVLDGTEAGSGGYVLVEVPRRGGAGEPVSESRPDR